MLCISSLNVPQYQIRFLGYKGVVRVDPELEGIQMRLRPSMEKFKVHDIHEADIEIARAFSSPGKMYLNRYVERTVVSTSSQLMTFSAQAFNHDS